MKAKGVQVKGWVCYCCSDSRSAKDIQAVDTRELVLGADHKIANDTGARLYVPVPGFIGLCAEHRVKHNVRPAVPQPTL